MSALQTSKLTEAEYLAIERAAEQRSEFVDGERFPMSGASVAHAIITTNLAAMLRSRLRGSGCRPLVVDMRTRSDRTRLYTYPDALIVCGALKFADDRKDTLTNPSVIFEVLSPSTESWDRGGKFLHYQRIDTLTDYVLVSQDQPLLEHFSRRDVGWHYQRIEGLDATLALPQLGLELPLAEVFEDVDFTAEVPRYP